MKNKSVVEFMIQHLNECLSFTVDHYGIKSETVNLTYQQKQDIIKLLSPAGETVILFDDDAEDKKIIFIYALLTRPANLFFSDRENPIDYISDNIDDIFYNADTNTPFGYIQEVIEIAVDIEVQRRKIISLEDANHSYRNGELSYIIRERYRNIGARLSNTDIIFRFHPTTHIVTEIRRPHQWEKHAADIQGFDLNNNSYVIVKPEKETNIFTFFDKGNCFSIDVFRKAIADTVIDKNPNADPTDVYNEIVNNLCDIHRRDIQALLEQHAGITPKMPSRTETTQQDAPIETILNPDSNQQKAMPKVNKI